MWKSLKNNILWVFFAVFVVLAVLFNSEPVVQSNGPFAFGKYIAWLAFFAFLFYTLDISRKESFYKSLRRMSPILWSRQIGVDLYIGVTMFLVLMYINEPSLLTFMLWVIPTLIFANLATLLYLALHYDSIVGLLMS